MVLYGESINCVPFHARLLTLSLAEYLSWLPSRLPLDEHCLESALASESCVFKGVGQGPWGPLFLFFSWYFLAYFSIVLLAPHLAFPPLKPEFCRCLLKDWTVHMCCVVVCLAPPWHSTLFRDNSSCFYYYSTILLCVCVFILCLSV